jgi:hypothetical protein
MLRKTSPGAGTFEVFPLKYSTKYLATSAVKCYLCLMLFDRVQGPPGTILASNYQHQIEVDGFVLIDKPNTLVRNDPYGQMILELGASYFPEGSPCLMHRDFGPQLSLQIVPTTWCVLYNFYIS